jgi:hypothetical protein
MATEIRLTPSNEWAARPPCRSTPPVRRPSKSSNPAGGLLEEALVLQAFAEHDLEHLAVASMRDRLDLRAPPGHERAQGE